MCGRMVIDAAVQLRHWVQQLLCQKTWGDPLCKWHQSAARK